jgi:hypothetical protein
MNPSSLGCSEEYLTQYSALNIEVINSVLTNKQWKQAADTTVGTAL